MIQRIVKFGVGEERPGTIVYEAKLEADDLEGLATQVRSAWEQHSAQLECAEGDVFLHLIVEVEQTGSADFDVEDELLELLDP